MAANMFSKGLLDKAAKLYQKSLAGELNKMGLRWEDLLVSGRPAVAEALQLSDPDVLKGRLRRLKRASDLSYKAKNYTDYKSADHLEPFKMELWDDVKKIEAREEEYEMLDFYKK